MMAFAAVLAIFTNALFMQHGPHPAPLFAARLAAKQEVPAVATLQQQTPVALPQPAPMQQRATQVEPKHNDPIAELIAPSKRVLAVQRALADFGYGQIKPTGEYDANTRLAIEKFERDHRLPVTGQISDRLVRELAAMTGRSLE
jgi:peptidoglycan hydrolase-like protein with peptidoglycan-binding domain